MTSWFSINRILFVLGILMVIAGCSKQRSSSGETVIVIKSQKVSPLHKLAAPFSPLRVCAKIFKNGKANLRELLISIWTKPATIILKIK